MTVPTLTAAAAYYAAKELLDTLLDVSDRPWEDAVTLITRAAHLRRASVIEDALLKARFEGLDKAARFQDLADKMTDPPSPEDRDIDAEVKQFFEEGR